MDTPSGKRISKYPLHSGRPRMTGGCHFGSPVSTQKLPLFFFFFLLLPIKYISWKDGPGMRPITLWCVFLGLLWTNKMKTGVYHAVKPDNTDWSIYQWLHPEMGKKPKVTAFWSFFFLGKWNSQPFSQNCCFPFSWYFSLLVVIKFLKEVQSILSEWQIPLYAAS